MAAPRRFLALAAALAANATLADAQTATGNLSVVTQVDAACTAPSPSGNLTLPFNSNFSLTNQPMSFQVVVTATCSGAATITSLEFGDGRHATDGGGTHAHTRRMQGQNLTDTHLAYQLFTTSSPNESTRLLTSEEAADCADPGDGVCGNRRYYDPGISTLSQTVHGRIHDATGAFGNQRLVPGDIYSDLVLMTVHYGG